jgi:hypothetical protein
LLKQVVEAKVKADVWGGDKLASGCRREIDDFKPARGPPGIEAEGYHIEFRGIRIKRLRS